ncbi:hypothetical protein NC651_027120 [Populus alba x Populus x berolinensis]|nr:hypothetical protein NC651_027088 [Populus alba x Populus x berolinensis]KAJ6886654.1 hypothetical protein NC651_027118 [Populus alba x Populus x berolinensis]KAJ6886656.1 hypothetical protein NC651_027120 [Populus alba x Populus x berolinensis]
MQIGRFSLHQLQGLGRIYGRQDKTGSNSGPFEIRGGSPANQAAMPVDVGNRRIGSVPSFGAGSGNPSMTLRNLILSPIKRPQLSRSRPKAIVEKQTGYTIRTVRSDQGGEYTANDFEAFCTQQGIRHQMTPAYTPPLNGVAER